MKHRIRLIVLLVVASAAILVFQWSPHGPALAVRAECPARVRLGQETLLRLVIGNPHRHPVVLDDIDLARPYVDGLMVVNVTPPARDSRVHHRLGVVSLSYDEPLQPGALREWIVRLKAVKPGPHAGELAVYSATNVTSRFLETTVIP